MQNNKRRAYQKPTLVRRDALPLMVALELPSELNGSNAPLEE